MKDKEYKKECPGEKNIDVPKKENNSVVEYILKNNDKICNKSNKIKDK